MNIQAVYFDLGGVILRTEDRRPRTNLAASLGLDYVAIDEAVFAGESGRLASIGAISEEQHWQNVVRALNLPEHEIPRFSKAFFAGDDIDWTLVGFLRSLRPRIKVGLISNAWSGLRTWIKDQKFEDAFDHLIISAEVGIAKPDPRIYLYALEKLGCQPENAVFVDDMAGNVEAARALGMQGILFRDTVEAIAEIAKMLDL